MCHGDGGSNDVRAVFIGGNVFYEGANRAWQISYNAGTNDRLMFWNDVLGTAAPQLVLHDSGGMSYGTGYGSNDPGLNDAIFEGDVGIGTTSPGQSLS